MRHHRAILIASALMLPLAAAGAQPNRPGPRGLGGRPGPSATELLDARRQLELTPRQVARLDSIERSQLAQRRQLRQQMQHLRDSVCANQRPCNLTADQRQQLRSRLEADRPQREALWRRDSVARARAMSVLDSTQRGRVQGWRMAQARRLMERRPGQVGPRLRGPDQGWNRFDGPRGLRGPRGVRPGFDGPGAGPRALRDFGPMRPGFRRDDGPMGPRLNRDDVPMGPGGQLGPGPRMRRPGGRPTPPDSL